MNSVSKMQNLKQQRIEKAVLLARLDQEIEQEKEEIKELEKEINENR